MHISIHIYVGVDLCIYMFVYIFIYRATLRQPWPCVGQTRKVRLPEFGPEYVSEHTYIYISIHIYVGVDLWIYVFVYILICRVKPISAGVRIGGQGLTRGCQNTGFTLRLPEFGPEYVSEQTYIYISIHIYVWVDLWIYIFV